MLFLHVSECTSAVKKGMSVKSVTGICHENEEMAGPRQRAAAFHPWMA